MSTDTYIDVFTSTTRDQLDVDELEHNDRTGYTVPHDTLRIGYISAIRGLSFDWYEWLTHFARATDVINDAVIESVRATYWHLRRLYTAAENKNPAWLQVKYGTDLQNVNLQDIVGETELIEFLRQYQGLHWRLRVD